MVGELQILEEYILNIIFDENKFINCGGFFLVCCQKPIIHLLFHSPSWTGQWEKEVDEWKQREEERREK